MRIGVPKEVKNHEYRVGVTPSMARDFIDAGHRVLVETQAASAIGWEDEAYLAVGAEVVDTAEEVYSADMIIKVKEPQASEFPLMHEGQIIFSYLHLAPDPEQTRQLIERGVIAIAYETVTDNAGQLPLLQPMSEIAGRISIQAGATCLQLNNGGRGVLLGGVPGVAPAKVIVIGGGVVGLEAARMALGLGADVTVLDRNLRRLRYLDEVFGPRLKTLFSSAGTIEEVIPDAELVIGSVLIPGKSAPKLLTRSLIQQMQRGAVVVDVAIDQGGCAETSRPTSHSEPTYEVDGVVHYCVTNMPGACARTATVALTNATCQYALRLANLGYKQALRDDPNLLNGLNVYRGKVTNEPVAHDLDYTYHPALELI